MAERREAVERAKQETPIETLREFAASRKHHSLSAKLGEGSGTCVIAEMKKASPSAGLLRPDYRPRDIAAAYEKAGACGISVLTEPKHFMGSGAHLGEARAAVDLPILRKDFMCDPYQVCEAAAWGADVVLLIAAVLDDDTMRVLYDEATELGLDVLAEAHTAEEVDRVLALDRAIVGVNSRNLATLRTDLSVARGLAGRIPSERLSIAESGIRQRQDIDDLERAGYRGFLVGETLMAAEDPAGKLRELRGE